MLVRCSGDTLSIIKQVVYLQLTNRHLTWAARSPALAPSGAENGAVDSLVYPCTCSHNVDDGSQLRRFACWPRCLAGLVRCKRSFRVLWFKPALDRAAFPEPH